MKICKICFKEFEENERECTICNMCTKKYEKVLSALFKGFVEQLEEEVERETIYGK